MSESFRTDSPVLSVVVASYQSGRTIERCLDALRQQRCAQPFEIVVVDSGTDDAARIVTERYPEVSLVRSESRMYPGAARNLGIEKACSELIGFVDADCVASPDWVESVIRSHGRSDSVVGGVVDNGNRRSFIAWALYLCEFTAWMPGTRSGAMRDIPTCCLSMTRRAWRDFGPFRSDGYCSDTALNWKLTDAGRSPRFDPAIRVAHIDRVDFRRFSRKRLMHGRAFARMRVEERGLSRIQRFIYAVGTPLLPGVLALRIAHRVFFGTKTYRGRLLATSPLVLLGLCLWSAGEFAGYLSPN